MTPDWGRIILELNPLIAIIPATLAAYLTYRLGKRKSDREERFAEMNYWKNVAEEERKRRIEVEDKLAKVSQNLQVEKAKNDTKEIEKHD